MHFPVDKGYLIYSDRTGSYEGIEFEILPDNESVLAEMKRYEKYYDLVFFPDRTLNNVIEFNFPPILDRDIKQIKTQKSKDVTKPSHNEFYLTPNWQCDYCYYQNLSCNPNMSKNKIAEIKDNRLVIRKDYGEYEDRLNNIINPKDDNDFYKFVKGVQK